MVIAVTDIAATTIGGLAYPGQPVDNTDWVTAGNATGDQFAGVAAESMTSTEAYTVANGYKPGVNCINVQTVGEFEFKCSNFTRAHVGNKAWASLADAQTVLDAAAGHEVPVGIITWVSAVSGASLCRVRITGTAMTTLGIAA
jgi:hypothetical protein